MKRLQSYIEAWYPLEGAGKGTPASDCLTRIQRVWPDAENELEFCLPNLADVGFIIGKQVECACPGLLCFKLYRHSEHTPSGMACFPIDLQGRALDKGFMVGHPGMFFIRRMIHQPKTLHIYTNPFTGLASYVELGPGRVDSDHAVTFNGIRLPNTLRCYDRIRVHGAHACSDGLNAVLHKTWPDTDIRISTQGALDRVPALVGRVGWERTLIEQGWQHNPIPKAA